jgi:hypothetical protein
LWPITLRVDDGKLFSSMRKWWLLASFFTGLGAALAATPGASRSRLVLAGLCAASAVALAVKDLRTLTRTRSELGSYRELRKGSNFLLATAALVTFLFCLLNLGLFYGLRWERLALLRENKTASSLIPARVLSSRVDFFKPTRLVIKVEYTAPYESQVTTRSFHIPRPEGAVLRPGEDLRILLASEGHARVRPADFDLDDAAVPVAFAWVGFAGVFAVFVWGLARQTLARKISATL